MVLVIPTVCLQRNKHPLSVIIVSNDSVSIKAGEAMSEIIHVIPSCAAREIEGTTSMPSMSAPSPLIALTSSRGSLHMPLVDNPWAKLPKIASALSSNGSEPREPLCLGSTRLSGWPSLEVVRPVVLLSDRLNNPLLCIPLSPNSNATQPLSLPLQLKCFPTNYLQKP